MNILIHIYFYILDKLLGKIQLLFNFVIANIFRYVSQRKVNVRSGEDRREFSYTEHIPERRSGKDRRTHERHFS